LDEETTMGTVYERRHRVVLGDVDSAGVVYFANVFRWHEQNLSEWLAQCFEPLGSILARGCGLPVVACSSEFPGAIRQDDVLTLESCITEVGTSSFLFRTTMSNGALLVCVVDTRHVWCERKTGGRFVPKPLPERLLAGHDRLPK
jgi:YbgC/YbaW family acyl-CoA thioester hydrolase